MKKSTNEANIVLKVNLKVDFREKKCALYTGKYANAKPLAHDVTEAILLFQINPVRDEFFSDVHAFFCSNKFA